MTDPSIEVMRRVFALADPAERAAAAAQAFGKGWVAVAELWASEGGQFGVASDP